MLGSLVFALASGAFTVAGRSDASARARQRAGRVALLGRRRVEHALLAARSDQRVELQHAAGAWRWNASVDGEDEYYRTTPLYANGRLFTVATTHRYAYAIDPENGTTLWSWKLEEGIRWQKAPRQFAGRGLAYWTDGRGNERVIVVTPGYHMAILDAKTGKGIRRSARTASSI